MGTSIFDIISEIEETVNEMPVEWAIESYAKELKEYGKMFSDTSDFAGNFGFTMLNKDYLINYSDEYLNDFGDNEEILNYFTVIALIENYRESLNEEFDEDEILEKVVLSIKPEKHERLHFFHDYTFDNGEFNVTTEYYSY